MKSKGGLAERAIRRVAEMLGLAGARREGDAVQAEVERLRTTALEQAGSAIKAWHGITRVARALGMETLGGVDVDAVVGRAAGIRREQVEVAEALGLEPADGDAGELIEDMLAAVQALEALAADRNRMHRRAQRAEGRIARLERSLAKRDAKIAEQREALDTIGENASCFPGTKADVVAELACKRIEAGDDATQALSIIAQAVGLEDEADAGDVIAAVQARVGADPLTMPSAAEIEAVRGVPAILPESHVDHGLTRAQLEAALALVQLGDDPVTVATVELPEDVGTVPCGLYGPIMGDAPVPDSETFYAPRGSREGMSRMTRRPMRQTRTITLIVGPHEGFRHVLYTAFGGPAAPREPWDPTLSVDEERESLAFWAEHALAAQGGSDA